MMKGNWDSRGMRVVLQPTWMFHPNMEADGSLPRVTAVRADVTRSIDQT